MRYAGRMTARKVRTEDRRGMLLEEAARLFGKGGYDNTSMRDIAAAFGVLPGSLYHHFRSKEELFVAVYAEGIDRIIAAVRKAAARHDDPWDRLEAACATHLQMLLGKRSYAAAVVADWPAKQGVLGDELIRHRDRYEELFRSLIDAVPLRPGVDRRYFRLGLLGALNWSLNWYRPGRHSPSAVARQLLLLFRPAGADAAPPAASPAQPGVSGALATNVTALPAARPPRAARATASPRPRARGAS